MSAYTIIDAPQRSPEWFQARVGRLTGSRAADMLATIKSGEAAARRDLRWQLVTERLTGQPQEDGYVNAAMQWGIDHEADAVALYEALQGVVVERTGFLAHNSLMVGCSLDGHVGDMAGLLEVKCPKSATHIQYLASGQVPAAYLPQIMHNLWVTGATWCDFVSFDPRFPAAHRFFCARVTKHDLDLGAYAKKAELFLADVDAAVAGFKGWSILHETA